MNNPADEISQSERRKVMESDRLARKASTYHQLAEASADELAGGRFAKATNKQTVVGSSPISYPRQPSTSPWFNDPVPPEMPLGYDINAMEPVGERHEIEKSLKTSPPSAHGGDGTPTSSIGGGSVGVKPKKRWRRI
jgi:hypothetical protein